MSTGIVTSLQGPSSRSERSNPATVPRLCLRGCGTPLSRFNDGKFCGPCERATPLAQRLLIEQRQQHRERRALVSARPKDMVALRDALSDALGVPAATLTDLKICGRLMWQRRSELHLGQREFARRSGISQTLVSMLESGERPAVTPQTARKLITALRLDSARVDAATEATR